MAKPKLLPVPAFRRRAIWAFVLAQTPQLVNIAIMFLGLAYPVFKVSIRTQMLALAVTIVLTLGATIWIGVTSRRITREAVSRDGAMCIHCLYQLPVEDVDGKCPECGRAFTKEENRVAWGSANVGGKATMKL